MSTPSDPMHGTITSAAECVTAPPGMVVLEHTFVAAARRLAVWIDQGWESTTSAKALLRVEQQTGSSTLVQEQALKNRGACINIPYGPMVKVYVTLDRGGPGPAIDPRFKVYAQIAPGAAVRSLVYGGEMNVSGVATASVSLDPDTGTPLVPTSTEFAARFATALRLTVAGTPAAGTTLAEIEQGGAIAVVASPGVYFLSLHQKTTVRAFEGALTSWQWETFA